MKKKNIEYFTLGALSGAELMPFFCFIVYNGHTLCLINVIGPINVFGKLFFVNIFLFLHFGCPCKINFFYLSIFLQKKKKNLCLVWSGLEVIYFISDWNQLI